MEAFDSLIWTLWEVRFLTSGRLVSGGSPISSLGVMQSLSPCPPTRPFGGRQRRGRGGTKGPFSPPEASAGVNDVAGEGGWESGRRNARPRWHGIRQNPWSSYRTAWQADHFKMQRGVSNGAPDQLRPPPPAPSPLTGPGEHHGCGQWLPPPAA